MCGVAIVGFSIRCFLFSLSQVAKQMEPRPLLFKRASLIVVVHVCMLVSGFPLFFSFFFFFFFFFFIFFLFFFFYLFFYLNFFILIFLY